MCSVDFDQPETWSATDRATVDLAAHVIGVALSRYTGFEPDVSFNLIFGSQTARYNDNLTTWGHSTEDIIEFKHKRIGLPLVIHELGHTFDRLAGGLPRDMTRLNGITFRYMWKRPPENGHQWWGSHPVFDPGGEEANERWADTFCDYCLGLLAWNAQGRALTAWVEANMPQWIGATHALLGGVAAHEA